MRDPTAQARQWPEWMDTIQTFRDEAAWDGKIHGSWLSTDVRVLAYNKTLFRQAGLDPDAPPTNWDELLADAKQVADPPSSYGFEFPGMKEEHTAHRFFALLYSNGGQILDESMTPATFNSEAGVEALQVLVDLVDSGATPKSIVSGSPDDLDRGICQGKFAMGIVAKTTGLAKEVISDFSVEKYREDFGVAPIPKAPGG